MVNNKTNRNIINCHSFSSNSENILDCCVDVIPILLFMSLAVVEDITNIFYI